MTRQPRRRQTVRVTEARFSLLFQPLPAVFAIAREVPVPHMIDPYTKNVAIPRAKANEVLARLEASGYSIEYQLRGTA